MGTYRHVSENMVPVILAFRRRGETDNIRWITTHKEVRNLFEISHFVLTQSVEDLFLRFLLIRELSTKSLEQFIQYFNSVYPQRLLVNKILILKGHEMWL